MAGRGFIKEAVNISDTDKIRVLRNGRWNPFYRPVNGDRVMSGVCLAESFAESYAKDHDDTLVGLIPCADGGTSLDHWQPGEVLFDHAVCMAKLAMRSSTIVGVLWHQGETDCARGLWDEYYEKCKNIFDRLRQELNLYNVPFIVGGLGEFLPQRGIETDKPNLSNYKLIDNELLKMAEEDKLIGFASAEGLTANPDNLHFNSASLYEFGKRYYKAFKEIENKDIIFTEKGTDMDIVGAKNIMENY